MLWALWKFKKYGSSIKSSSSHDERLKQDFIERQFVGIWTMWESKTMCRVQMPSFKQPIRGCKGIEEIPKHKQISEQKFKIQENFNVWDWDTISAWESRIFMKELATDIFNFSIFYQKSLSFLYYD